MQKIFAKPSKVQVDLKEITRAKNAALRDTDDLKKEKEELQTELTTLSDNRVVALGEKKTLEDKIKNLAKELSSLGDKKGKDLQIHDSEIKLLEEQEKAQNETIEGLKKQKSGLDKEIADSIKSIASFKLSVLGETHTLAHLKIQVKEFIVKAKKQEQNLKSDMSAGEASVKRSLEALKENTIQLNALKNEIGTITKFIEDEKVVKKKAIQEKGILQIAIDDLKKELTEMKKDLKSAEKKYETVKLNALKRQKEVDSIDNRKRELKKHYEKAGMTLKI